MSNNIPKHKDPNFQDRVAYAPYNFVPLPEAILTVSTPPVQDVYHSELLTGKLECSLTTASPMYVRAAQTWEEYTHKNDDEKPDPIKPDHPFYGESKETLLIPGSSLRGMLRNLVEVVAHSRLGFVSGKNLFYRSVEDTSMGDAYRARMKDNVRAGFYYEGKDKAWIEPTVAGRVLRDTVLEKFGGFLYERGRGPKKTPMKNLQHKTVYVSMEARALQEPTRFYRVETFETKKLGGLLEGILVITGDMQNKKQEFVFLKETTGEKLELEDEQVYLFEDDDQITQYQQYAFPKGNGRGKDGGLKSGDPVFYLLNEAGKVEAFGRAYMFRLPYQHAPAEMLSTSLQANANLYDMAEAIFGFVDQEKGSRPSISGRVFVSDGVLQGNAADALLSREPITLKILSSPKPTTFQHYLTQTNPDNQRMLNHYDNDPNNTTTLRGYKFYWHKGNVTRNQFEADPAHIQEFKPLYAPPVKPVKADQVFKFTIHFDNLTPQELGALIWVLDKAGDSKYRLKLGLGKPYGLGSVAIHYKTVFTDRKSRYQELFSGLSWNEGVQNNPDTSLKKAREAFKSFVLSDNRVTPIGMNEIENLPRIKELLAMLTWDGHPPVEITRYMNLEEFAGRQDAEKNPRRLSKRPVLPSPTKILNFNWYSSLEPQAPSVSRRPNDKPKSDKGKRREAQPDTPPKQESSLERKISLGLRKKQQTQPVPDQPKKTKPVIEKPIPVVKMPSQLQVGDFILAIIEDAPRSGDITLVPKLHGPEDMAIIPDDLRSIIRYKEGDEILVQVIEIDGDDENGWLVTASPVV